MAIVNCFDIKIWKPKIKRCRTNATLSVPATRATLGLDWQDLHVKISHRYRDREKWWAWKWTWNRNSKFIINNKSNSHKHYQPQLLYPPTSTASMFGGRRFSISPPSEYLLTLDSSTTTQRCRAQGSGGRSDFDCSKDHCRSCSPIPLWVTTASLCLRCYNPF